MEIIRKAAGLIPVIKECRPLVHHITNYVTMNDSANIILAIGGSPVMANAPEEVGEVTATAKALVLNIGTPNSENFRAMLLAAERAKEMKLPIVFDPVGAGCTFFRREICRRLLSDIRPDIIKGNFSEIMYLADAGSSSCCIDSLSAPEAGRDIVEALAAGLGCIVAATGERDVLSDGRRTYTINNGHKMLSRITGTGCMTASLIGAFSGVTEEYLTAAFGGIMAMGIAGQLAFDSLRPGEGTGMFRVRLLDHIYNLTGEIFLKEGAASEE